MSTSGRTLIENHRNVGRTRGSNRNNSDRPKRMKCKLLCSRCGIWPLKTWKQQKTAQLRQGCLAMTHHKQKNETGTILVIRAVSRKRKKMWKPKQCPSLQVMHCRHQTLQHTAQVTTRFKKSASLLTMMDTTVEFGRRKSTSSERKSLKRHVFRTNLRNLLKYDSSQYGSREYASI